MTKYKSSKNCDNYCLRILIPDSRFPIPDFRFPTPDSRFYLLDQLNC
ncbi:MAG: hypothetical protein F6K65_03570 [Moorea sp. SIO3C2]|nr:hypothetical protein [Moorena sp. SIO3C2]